MLDIHDKPIFNFVKISDVVEGRQLALLRSLAVVQMQKCHLMVLVGNCSRYAAVHTAADKYDGERHLRLPSFPGSRYICASAAENARRAYRRESTLRE